LSRTLAAARGALTWIVLSASLVTVGLLGASPSGAATKTYTANTSVNVRTGASTSKPVLTLLPEGAHVLAAGAVSGDWLPITYANTTAYVWADYLDADKTAATVVTTGPAGKKKALVNVNVRASASLDASISSILTKGTAIKVTGLSSGVFLQVSVGGKTGWIHSQFLSTTTDTTPDVLASYTATSSLALRATADVTATNQVTIAKGKTVGGTGTHSGGYSQVVYSGKVGWVVTGYLKAASGTPDALVLPHTKGTRWAIAATAPVLAKANAKATQLATISLAAAVRITGTTDGDFTQIIWDGATAWIATAQLTATQSDVDLGSTSLNKLEPYGKAAVLEVRAHFPKITTIYGWRSSSDYSSDHPNGRAIDNMIPDYKNNKALGDSLAQYFIDNGKRLHVTYVIWRQRIYTLSRGSWKAMEDRGSDTQNHMNHVHVSFEPS
jgi:uncharacterized protein YgiM (DUF1202 family)